MWGDLTIARTNNSSVAGALPRAAPRGRRVSPRHADEGESWKTSGRLLGAYRPSRSTIGTKMDDSARWLFTVGSRGILRSARKEDRLGLDIEAPHRIHIPWRSRPGNCSSRLHSGRSPAF